MSENHRRQSNEIRLPVVRASIMTIMMTMALIEKQSLNVRTMHANVEVLLVVSKSICLMN